MYLYFKYLILDFTLFIILKNNKYYIINLMNKIYLVITNKIQLLK
jgi:hypothetical protein